MAARTRYSTKVEAYLDREIAAAKAQAGRTEQIVSEQVGSTVLATVLHALRRGLRRNLASLLVALLPLVAVGLDALLRALGQPGLATAPALVALLWLALFIPWHAWQMLRRARGLPPAQFPLARLIKRASARPPSRQWYDPLPLSSGAAPLLGGLTAVPALLVLTLAPPAPGLLLGSLIALPILLTALWLAVGTTISGLSAVGGVNASSIVAVPGGLSSLAPLDERLTRLTQMRDWLRDDTLRVMVDDVIGRQVRASERRQAVYSAVIGIVSLMAGWLLSAISPISLATLFHR
jgi:hypothetical protein